MKSEIGVCYVTEGIAQSIVIFVTIIISIFICIIIVIIITNTITTTIQASACSKWHSQRASIHVTEQAC
jgi:5-bromo-4-chloroindolyl phosphate hydrolysis protein